MKPKDQFLVHLPEHGEQLVVYDGQFEGTHLFRFLNTDGKSVGHGVLEEHQLAEWDLTPIDETHEKYVNLEDDMISNMIDVLREIESEEDPTDETFNKASEKLHKIIKKNME
jgi:hypothetical protein